MKHLYKWIVVALLAVMVSAMALAVEFPVFVGKGAVQSALGWNNAQFQANAGSLQFAFVEELVQYVVCEQQTTGHVRSGSRTSSVVGSLEYQNRSQNQVTGIWLTGYGAVTEEFGDWELDQQQPLPAGCFNEGHGWAGTVTEEIISSGWTVNGVPFSF